MDATADQTENIAQNRQMRRQLERARKRQAPLEPVS